MSLSLLRQGSTSLTFICHKCTVKIWCREKVKHLLQKYIHHNIQENYKFQIQKHYYPEKEQVFLWFSSIFISGIFIWTHYFVAVYIILYTLYLYVSIISLNSGTCPWVPRKLLNKNNCYYFSLPTSPSIVTTSVRPDWKLRSALRQCHYFVFVHRLTFGIAE